jgi:hypothetical protein
MARGGSMQPMLVLAVQGLLTELRTEQLREPRGGPEGQ